MIFFRTTLQTGYIRMLIGAFFLVISATQPRAAETRTETFPVLDAFPFSDQVGALNQFGAHVYTTYCVGCHGVKGDGKGPASQFLIVKPRDFTKGIFKFRSTPSGTLPTDQDLYKTISRGIYGTAMPGFALLPEPDRLAVIQYVKAFYPQWSQRGPGTSIVIPNPPKDLGSAKAVARGRQIYELLECAACHGQKGRGDGPSAASLEPDAWGNKQRPFNFTRGQLRSGPTVKDIYRTFMTGINGTAMPSYADIFSEPDGEYIKQGDAWNLVSYILSLRKETQAGTD
jgi:cytochrome c oxidase cbb3-type subunit I/II